MKFSLVSALVVLLAVAHGSEGLSLVKREAPADVEKIAELIKEMSASVTTATQEMVEKIKALEVTNTAQTYMEDSRARIQPLVERVQAEAGRLQDSVRPYISNIEEQVKPLTDNLQAQVKPLTDNLQAQVKPLTDNFQAQVKPLTDLMEKLFQQVVDQSKALLPPQ